MDKFNREYNNISAINKKFPYDLRDIQKAVGSTGSHSGFFKDQSKKFDWKEGMEYYEHELKTRKYLGKLDSQFSNNRSIPIAEKHIFITKKAALQVALSLKTPEARALANYLLDRMEANEATLKKIQEIGINNYLKQQDRVNSRNGFTNAIKSNEPNAGPSEYKRISAISRRIQTQSEEVEKLPYMKHIAGEVGSKDSPDHINVFSYDSKQIRNVMINGDPWWVAKDVCDILEIQNPTMSLKNLDEDERSKYNLGRQGDVNIINESGLYSLILQSNKPEAKKFKKWITSEVLPSIRKTGSYSTQLPTTFQEALRALADQVDQVEMMKPKAEQYDLYINNGGYQKIGDVAKTLNIAPNTFHKMLRDAKILQENYVPYAEYKKYFHVVVTPLSGTNFFTSFIKPEGVSYLVKRLNLTNTTKLLV